jgi:pimeloyl-ACP methyl ester carboxylesterase
MDMWSIALRVVLVIVVLRVLVWWLEPRMAFYPTAGVQETPAVAGVPFRDVRIDTADGQRLHAWWMEQASPRAQVVFFHGNGGNLSMWLDIFVQLWRRGFSVMAVDYRGYGASTGSASERGLYRDADATIQMFQHQFRRQGIPVIYWGRSIGAPVVAHAAVGAAPDGVVLETPMPDARSVLRTNPVLWLLSFMSTYTFPTSRLLQKYHGPLLILHGDQDEIVPFAAGRRVFERAPSVKKRFVAIEGAHHNDLHVTDPGVYWSTIDTFVSELRPQ